MFQSSKETSPIAVVEQRDGYNNSNDIHYDGNIRIQMSVLLQSQHSELP